MRQHVRCPINKITQSTVNATSSSHQMCGISIRNLVFLQDKYGLKKASPWVVHHNATFTQQMTPPWGTPLWHSDYKSSYGFSSSSFAPKRPLAKILGEVLKQYVFLNILHFYIYDECCRMGKVGKTASSLYCRRHGKVAWRRCHCFSLIFVNKLLIKIA